MSHETFKASYKDRKGKKRESARWYCEFVDHLETTRRLPIDRYTHVGLHDQFAAVESLPGSGTPTERCSRRRALATRHSDATVIHR